MSKPFFENICHLCVEVATDEELSKIATALCRVTKRDVEPSVSSVKETLDTFKAGDFREFYLWLCCFLEKGSLAQKSMEEFVHQHTGGVAC